MLTVIKKYRHCFEVDVSKGSGRGSYSGELRFESGKYFVVPLVGIFAWLPYIPGDLALHRYPMFAALMHLSLCVLSAILVLLVVTKPLKHRPSLTLKILITYLYVVTPIVTATSGEAAITAYLGGCTFVMLLLPIAPLSLKYKFTVQAMFIAVFAVTCALYSTGIVNSATYAVVDALIACLFSGLLSYIHNRFRFKTWQRRQELKATTFERNAIRHDLDEVLELKTKLANSNRAKSEFLSRMSHEMRTPINIIMGIVQMSRIQPDYAEEYFDEIEIASYELKEMIDDILDASGLEYGVFKLADVVFDFMNAFDGCVRLIRPQVLQKNQTLLEDFDSNLPKTIVGDEKRFKQVIFNLLANAVKFSPEHGEIRLSAAMIDECESAVTLKIEVSDNGIGISKEKQDKIFEMFEQGDGGVDREYSGIGVGLSLSKRIVELMDGEIWIESLLGEGTTVKFTCKMKKQQLY